MQIFDLWFSKDQAVKTSEGNKQLIKYKFADQKFDPVTNASTGNVQVTSPGELVLMVSWEIGGLSPFQILNGL